MDMTPSRGMPTAVMSRPSRARGRAEPALAPKMRGKMRFPAPKNRPKRVEPMGRPSFEWGGVGGRPEDPVAAEGNYIVPQIVSNGNRNFTKSLHLLWPIRARYTIYTVEKWKHLDRKPPWT